MSKDERAHPKDEDLLLYLDGELESAPSESTRSHLDSCWTCRMRASSIQATILEFAKERERSAVPDPPAAWRDLTGDFDRIHELARPASLLKRITTGVLFRNGRVAIFAAVTAAAAAVGWFALPRESETVARSSANLPETSAPGIEASARAPAPRSAPTTQFAPASIHDELAVIAELHRLRADLGEPIDLDLTKDDRLILKASGLEPRRALEIRRAMAKFSDLRLQLSEPHSEISSSANHSESARRPIAFEQELIRYSGGREPLQNLANDVLDASDRIAMYAHALDKIDRRFQARELTFEPQDRDLFNKIRGDYQSGARQGLQSLRTLMDPLFRELGIQPKSSTHDNLLETALETDRLTNAAFAGAQSDLSDQDIYQKLHASIARLAELSE